MKNKKSDVVLYYDGIAKGYDGLYLDEQREKFRLIKDNMMLAKDSKVLDVGCGTFFSYYYFKWDMYGIEPSPGMVNVFLDKSPDEKERIKVGFAEELSFFYEKESFDAVICVSALHHFKDFELAFEEIKKVCKHSGLFGFTLLRNIAGFDYIERKLCESFEVIKRVDSTGCKDVVFICRRNDLKK